MCFGCWYNVHLFVYSQWLMLIEQLCHRTNIIPDMLKAVNDLKQNVNAQFNEPKDDINIREVVIK